MFAETRGFGRFISVGDQLLTEAGLNLTSSDLLIEVVKDLLKEESFQRVKRLLFWKNEDKFILPLSNQDVFDMIVGKVKSSCSDLFRKIIIGL